MTDVNIRLYESEEIAVSNTPTYEELEQRVQEAERKHVDHQRITKELLESEERFRALHDASFGGVIIHDKGRILDCNQGLSDMTGYASEELIGKNGFDLIAPDSLEQVVQNIRKGHDRQYEVEGVRKDGSFYPLAINGKNIPYKGREVRVIEFRDISERKQAEEALRESEVLHAKMVANIGEVIVLIDENGINRYKSPNIEKHFGWKPEEVVGRPTMDNVHPEDREAVGEILANLLGESRSTVNLECRYRCRDGSYKWIEFTGTNLLDDPGICGVLGNYRDITNRYLAKKEKAKLEFRLQQAQKMEAIGTLAGGIAHDFNNILGAILGYGELARDDAPQESRFQHDVDQILVAANRAKDLVKQILDFGRHTQAVSNPLKIQPLIEEGLKMLRSSIPTTISIVENIDSDCGTILADPTQVHQILMNLCTNAFHAMEETGGVISVTLGSTTIEASDAELLSNVSPGEYLRLTVGDTGAGIRPDVIDRIFDPYFSTKEVGRGTGMGLAIIHGIMKNSGGAVAVDSRLGEGSTFEVYFPVVEDESPHTVASPLGRPSGTERILLVDDEILLCEMGKEVLERLGYRVTMCSSSVDALKTFRNAPDEFDLVMTDQTMPGMTGSELAEQILQIRPEIPIILCTGYSSLINEHSANVIGIKEFALKPLTNGVMGKLVRKVLDAS
jgi:PAS domain S-box-containing protein